MVFPLGLPLCPALLSKATWQLHSQQAHKIHRSLETGRGTAGLAQSLFDLAS